VSLRRILILIILLLLVIAFRPRTVWAESQRMWAQRDRIFRVLAVVIIVYLAYGIFQLYRQGWFDW